MKKSCLFFIIILLCGTMYIGLGNRTFQIDGYSIEKGEQKKAEAVVKYKIRNQLFDFQKLKGSISVSLGTSKDMAVKYNFMHVFKSEDIYYVDISYYSENMNRMASGKMYFDNRMEEIVLVTEEMKFISADKNFCERVSKLNVN